MKRNSRTKPFRDYTRDAQSGFPTLLEEFRCLTQWLPTGWSRPKVGRGGEAVGSRIAASIVCWSLEFLELRVSTVCLTLAKPKYGQIFVKFTLSPS